MSKTDGQVRELASLLRIMGDGTRLRILLELRKGERNVGQLCRTLRLRQPTVSHHLGLLRMGQIVSSRRSGKRVFYSIHEPARPPYAGGVKAFLKDAAALRLGPLVVGMA